MRQVDGMQTRAALDQLRRHQDALADLLDRTSGLLTGEAEAARLPLAGLRWSLARKAREYQLFKHLELFDPAIARGRPAQAATAEAMKRACVAMGADLETYIRRWAARDAVAEWSTCRAETAAITLRLRRHLATERREVERLLAGCEQTRRAG